MNETGATTNAMTELLNEIVERIGPNATVELLGRVLGPISGELAWSGSRQYSHTSESTFLLDGLEVSGRSRGVEYLNLIIVAKVDNK